jgi:signal transduction histidine kinase
LNLDTQQELIEGLLQFVMLAEGERKLLAADLHDQTLSDLRRLAQLARRLLDKQGAAAEEEVTDGLRQIVAGLEAAMDEVRRAMESLSPSALDTLGLIPALESCLARASSACEPAFAARLVCSVSDDELELSEAEQLSIYRIVQEALNNVAKHAVARSVELKLVRADDELLILVSDDGCGMPTAGEMRRARGIENMRYRARLIGARLTFRPGPVCGTVVEVRMPLKA